jgi:hypothetical protein
MNDDHKRKLCGINNEDDNSPLQKRNRINERHVTGDAVPSENLQLLSTAEIVLIKKKLNILLREPKEELDDVRVEKLYSSLAQYPKKGTQVLQQFLQCDAVSVLMHAMNSSVFHFRAIALRLVGDVSVIDWTEYQPLLTAFLQVLKAQFQQSTEPPFQILDAILKTLTEVIKTNSNVCDVVVDTLNEVNFSPKMSQLLLASFHHTNHFVASTAVQFLATLIEMSAIKPKIRSLLQNEEIHKIIHSFLNSNETETFKLKNSMLDLIYRLLHSDTGRHYVHEHSLFSTHYFTLLCDENSIIRSKTFECIALLTAHKYYHLLLPMTSCATPDESEWRVIQQMNDIINQLITMSTREQNKCGRLVAIQLLASLNFHSDKGIGWLRCQYAALYRAFRHATEGGHHTTMNSQESKECSLSSPFLELINAVSSDDADIVLAVLHNLKTRALSLSEHTPFNPFTTSWFTFLLALINQIATESKDTNVMKARWSHTLQIKILRKCLEIFRYLLKSSFFLSLFNVHISNNVENKNDDDKEKMTPSQMITSVLCLSTPHVHLSDESESSSHFHFIQTSTRDFSLIMDDALNFLCELFNTMSIVSSVTFFTAPLIKQLIVAITAGLLSPLSDIRESFIKFLTSLFNILTNRFKVTKTHLGAISNVPESVQNILENIFQQFMRRGIFQLLFQRLHIDTEASVRAAALRAVETISSAEIGWRYLSDVILIEENLNKTSNPESSICHFVARIESPTSFELCQRHRFPWCCVTHLFDEDVDVRRCTGQQLKCCRVS